MNGSYRVFISHASDARVHAESMKRLLHAHGFHVAFEDGSLLAGADTVRLTAELEAADAVVVILSRMAATSEWVKNEVASALRRSKWIVPILVDRSAVDSPVGSLLGDLQFLDVTDMPPELVAKSAIGELERRGPIQFHEAPLPVAPLPSTSSSLRAVRLGVGLLVLLVGIGVGFWQWSAVRSSAVRRSDTRDEKVMRALVALGAAAATKLELGADGGVGPGDFANKVAIVLTRSLEKADWGRLEKSMVLWVDDNTEWTRYERESLEAIGVEFVLVHDLDEAKERLRNHRFDAVITDMTRDGDIHAGYDLLAYIKQTNPGMPVIIYTGDSTAGSQAEAIGRGALGETSEPQQLFEYVVRAIQGA
jgi:CheY-like chemotaxis protein